MTAERFRDNPGRSFIGVLQQIAAAAGDDGITVSGIVDRLDERAFGLLILLLTIPCLVPGLPGAQIIAIPIFLLSAQILIGRNEPWLPGWFLRLRVAKSWISSIAAFSGKSLRWTERLSKPRLRFLASGWGERIMAFVMMLAAMTIMMPITNTAPSLALTLMSLGLIQRDGLFALAGAAAALTWFALLGALIGGVFLGAGFAVQFFAEQAPWLLDAIGR